MKIKKGDSVIVTRGSDKGKTGKVSETHPADHMVTVEGVNVRTKHEKPSQQNRNTGGIIKAPMPISVSKVGLVRPGDPKKATRIGYKFDDKNRKVRVARQAKNKEIK